MPEPLCGLNRRSQEKTANAGQSVPSITRRPVSCTLGTLFPKGAYTRLEIGCHDDCTIVSDEWSHVWAALRARLSLQRSRGHITVYYSVTDRLQSNLFV